MASGAHYVLHLGIGGICGAAPFACGLVDLWQTCRLWGGSRRTSAGGKSGLGGWKLRLLSHDNNHDNSASITLSLSCHLVDFLAGFVLWFSKW